MVNSTGYKYSYKSQERGLTSLSVYNTGYQQCCASDPWGPGLRDHYLIHHVVSGKGSFTTADKCYEVNAGDTFLAYPDVTISYCPDPNDPWEYYWVGFNGSDAQMLLSQTDFSPQTPVISTHFGDELRTLLLDIYNSRGSQPYEQARMAGGLYIAIAYLMEQAKSPSLSDGLSTNTLRFALDFIAGSYSRRISADDIAQSAGVSRSGLYRIFIKHLGVSPVRYLNSLRMKQACTLLLRGGLTVEAVACSVGYDDALYFSRAFKAQMGCSPRNYIAKHKKRIVTGID